LDTPVARWCHVDPCSARAPPPLRARRCWRLPHPVAPRPAAPRPAAPGGRRAPHALPRLRGPCRRASAPPRRGGPGKADHGKAAAEDLQQQDQLKKALFGALYTLAKEKINDGPRMAYLTIMVDFMLICCLFLMPEYPWAADAHHP
jgi:hypothetical protein